MAWGGGWGGPGPVAGGHHSATANGLPFGGIPDELMEEATRLLATEPERPPSRRPFHQRPSEAERRRLSLWALVGAYPRLL